MLAFFLILKIMKCNTFFSRRYKVGWVVKKEGKKEKVVGLIPPTNKN